MRVVADVAVGPAHPSRYHLCCVFTTPQGSPRALRLAGRVAPSRPCAPAACQLLCVPCLRAPHWFFLPVRRGARARVNTLVHRACATATPQIALHGPGDRPHMWLPMGECISGVFPRTCRLHRTSSALVIRGPRLVLALSVRICCHFCHLLRCVLAGVCWVHAGHFWSRPLKDAARR